MKGGLLVPWDGTTFSECALAAAYRLGLPGRVLRVLVPSSPPALPGVAGSLGLRLTEGRRNQALEQEAREALDALQLPPGWERELLCGEPAEQITEAARGQAAELIVMASHGRRDGKRWLLGSVAEGVVRRSTCPVLLLRPELESTDFSRVLVPVDGSQPGFEVLQAVRRWLPPQAEVRALHVGGELEFPVGVPGRVVEGEPVEVILQQALHWPCQLLALSTHGRSGFRRLVLGSVAESVARRAHCAVMLFPRRE